MDILNKCVDFFLFLFSSAIKLDFLLYLLILAIVVFSLINIFNYIRKGKY